MLQIANEGQVCRKHFSWIACSAMNLLKNNCGKLRPSWCLLSSQVSRQKLNGRKRTNKINGSKRRWIKSRLTGESKVGLQRSYFYSIFRSKATPYLMLFSCLLGCLPEQSNDNKSTKDKKLYVVTSGYF